MVSPALNAVTDMWFLPFIYTVDAFSQWLVGYLSLETHRTHFVLTVKNKKNKNGTL
jgi:hypothetical protein